MARIETVVISSPLTGGWIDSEWKKCRRTFKEVEGKFVTFLFAPGKNIILLLLLLLLLLLRRRGT